MNFFDKKMIYKEILSTKIFNSDTILSIDYNELNYDNLFSQYPHFFIPTITLSSPKVYKIIELDDDNF